MDSVKAHADKHGMKVTEDEVEFHGMKMHRITIDPGRIVLCDYCNEDYTDSPKKGGILIQSKAVCPRCTPGARELLKQYHEERFLKGECPEGMTFADWVRSLR